MEERTMLSIFKEMIKVNNVTTGQILNFLEVESKATERIDSEEELQKIKAECKELYMPLLRYLERHSNLYQAIRNRFGMKIPNIINIGCVETLKRK